MSKSTDIQVIFKHYRKLKIGEQIPKGKSYYSKRAGGKVYHYQRGQTSWEPAARGGMTFCFLKLDGKIISWDVAECSHLDTFCYRIGREIAEGRARKMLEGYIF